MKLNQSISTNRAMRPAALLVDLDGVVRHWPREASARAERMGKLPAGAIGTAAFAPELLAQVVTGRITDREWRRCVALRLANAYPEAHAEEAVRQWSKSAGAVDGEVLDLLSAARRSAKLVLVSNATSRLGADLRRLALDRYFDHVVNSSAVGYAKPDPRMFEVALDAASVDREDAVFIDDTLDHVAAAEAFGLAAHHFTGILGLRAALEQHGILSPRHEARGTPDIR